MIWGRGAGVDMKYLGHQFCALKIENYQRKGKVKHLFWLSHVHSKSHKAIWYDEFLLYRRKVANKCVRNGKIRKSPFCNT